MTPERALAFLAFSVVAAGTPGPSNVLLAATGATVGLARGVPSLLGVGVGMGALMFSVVFGLGRLVLGHPTVLAALHWIGGAYLLWLAWKIAAADADDPAVDRRPVGFAGAAAFQWINPKSWIVCASAAATYLTAQSGSALMQALTLATLFVGAALPCGAVWLGFGAAAQRLLRTRRARRAFNVAMASVLALSVLLTAWS
jgi:threonine/homoserine/homoserine lactone efflux protein